MAQPRPLLVTNDADLLDDLLRLAAAADVEVDVAVDPAAARARWAAAPLVVLGGDVPSSAITSRPARAGVLLVCRGSPAEQSATRAAGAGVDEVLYLPAGDDDLVDRLAGCVASTVPPACVIGVLGGCGGAGASVLAAALALTAARRDEPAVLVDLDPLGGGLDLLLGIEGRPGSRWDEFAGLSGRLAPAALRRALPVVLGVGVLSYGRDADQPPGEAVCAVIEAARWGGGVVVLDLPRQLPSVSAAADLVDEIVLVVPADLRAASSARQLMTMLDGSARSVGLVVRRPPGSALSTQAVARAMSLPLLGEARAESGLAIQLGAGHPLSLRRRGPLATLSNRLLDQFLGSGRERAA